MMNGRACTIGSLAAAIGFLIIYPADPSAADDFYKGKTIGINVSGGGTYEATARAVARHMAKFIPGNPTIIVKQMTGAAGLRATNYIYNVAPKDGTEIAAVHGQIPTQPIFNKEGVQFDPSKLSWIGSTTKETYLSYMWHTSPVQSIEDARLKTAIVGGQAMGSMSVDMAILANEMLGTKYKIVTGYQGGAETRLAIERGELQGHPGTSYASVISESLDMLRSGKIKIIAQFGLTKHKEMPDVPLLYDYVIKPEDAEALKLYLARQETGKPYFGPPGMPADRLAILRNAFDQTVRDPAYLADAAKANLEADEPMTGQQMEEFVAQVYKAPSSAADRIHEAFRKFSPGK